MSGKKISELPILSNPSLTGVTTVVEGGVTYQSTLSSLQSLLVNTEISVIGGSISGDTIYINNSDGNSIPISGLTYITGATYSDAVLYITDNYNSSIPVSITGLSNPFIYNQTRLTSTNIVNSHESLFNHSDLVVQSGTIFIVEPDAEYYVLGDVHLNGTMIIDGTLKIGGVFYINGPIYGSGIII
jgi:hypothetical protein